jgi:hypothetical protein
MLIHSRIFYRLLVTLVVGIVAASKEVAGVVVGAVVVAIGGYAHSLGARVEERSPI